ncbi:MAG: hydroxyquinol 1,2-dioxygenase, partial [Acetobacteraceae bacterium]|nr:hydroxyquinol 1,2-dioxygenase [Acetobacteraceae bacterium]
MDQAHITYTEANLTQAVLDRIRPDCDPRIAQIMTALIRHVHDFVREVKLTPEEWGQGVAFLAELGKWCDDKRQEVILLSDVLGVTMLVDAIAHATKENVTETTVLGPFHRENPPVLPDGANIAPGIQGEPLDVEVRIADAEGRPIEGAQVDVWHASPDGHYDSQIGDGEQHTMRARLRSGADGMVRFSTIAPSSYPVPHDGPVGRMLGAMGRGPMRPAHVHFWIKADGYRDLITHVF